MTFVIRALCGSVVEFQERQKKVMTQKIFNSDRDGGESSPRSKYLALLYGPFSLRMRLLGS